MTDTSLIILAVVILLVMLLMSVQSMTLKWVRRRSRLAIEKRYAPHDIIMYSLAANFFGQTSEGLSQVRGNGALVLARNELWFKMALPQKELTIPLRDIIFVDTRKSHLKKTKFLPLVYVEFNSASGKDSVAWLVEEPEKWIKAIEMVKGP